MLKKTITYPDLDGNPVVEDFYFNLSKAEIAEMELSQKGGYAAYLRTIIDSEDGGQIIKAFKSILTAAIGRRSEDGKRFVKSEEITNEFLQTEAYSQLFMELVTDGEAAAAFIQGLMPADLVKQVSEEIGTAKDDVEVPAWIRQDRDPTTKELQTMSKEEMQEVWRRKTIRANQ